MGQPTCPFCYIATSDYPSLRRHCENKHKEDGVGGRQDKPKTNQNNLGKPKPCRFFKNGEGRCNPKSGKCSFDHSFIPFDQRELCRHRNQCIYKPYCIFYHPEDQENLNKEPARICNFSRQGLNCNRNNCMFVHPTNSGLDFHWDQLREPPPPTPSWTESSLRMMTSTWKQRVPVIVMNKRKMQVEEEKEETLSLTRSIKNFGLN